MLKLNVLSLLESKGYTKYALFNKLNNIRAINGEKLMNYTNFQNMMAAQTKNFNLFFLSIEMQINLKI